MAARIKDIARDLGVSVAGQQSVLALSRYSTSQIPTFYQPAFAPGNVRSGISGGIACARRRETAITPGRSSAWRDSRNEIQIPTFYQPAFAPGNVRSGISGGIACARRRETAITPGRSSAWRDSRNEI